MKSLMNLFGFNRPRAAKRKRPTQRRMLGLESLETRALFTADPLPVLMVIADQRDFYYQEYGDTRASLEAAGLDVQVAATTTDPSTPHANSGQGFGSGIVVPDLTLAQVDASDYSAIVFVGGWGSSMYQYSSFPGDYSDNHYDGDLATKQIVNDLINEFLADDKFVAAICHATTVLAWARVDGASPLAGLQVSVPYVGSPGVVYNGIWYNPTELGQYEQAVANGAVPNTAPGQYGDPTNAFDDALVSGQIITAENWDSALYFGELIANQVIAAANVELPEENLAPVATDETWFLAENAPAGTSVGLVAATDPNAGQILSYAIVGGNVGNAFAIDATNGQITVANAGALDFETNSVYELLVEVSDNGDASLSDTAVITVQLLDVVEPPPASVYVFGDDLIVQGTPGADTIYLWSGSNANEVFVWMNGVSYGSHVFGQNGSPVVYGGDGNDRIFATDARRGVSIFGQGGHDLITGGTKNDLLDGGDGVDRISGGPGDDLIRGGAGNDVLYGEQGNDVILGGEGNDTVDGGEGADVLLGGLGGDLLRGGSGDDVLIGGTTSYDHNDAALREIQAAWSGPGSFADRANLLSIGIALQIALRPGETVYNDGEIDTLCGNGGADLIFASLGDALYTDLADLVR